MKKRLVDEEEKKMVENVDEGSVQEQKKVWRKIVFRL
jgi:hypothetical protein